MNNSKSNNACLAQRTENAMTQNNYAIKPLRLAMAAALASLFLAPAAQAIEFSSDDGEWTGSWDTTVTYGASWRMEERDPNNVGKSVADPFIFLAPNSVQRDAVGRFSSNGDDGNLNYDDGDLVSHTAKITTELELRWRNFGAFTRYNYFYDFENEGNDKLTQIAQDEFVGSRGRLLDAYLFGDFEVGDQFLSLRLGRQNVSWGESTFIQGGINVINPVDVSKLRIAGAELKEAFLPQNMFWGSMDLTNSVSMEAFYLFEYEQIDPDPTGTYFSTNDFGTPGGQFAMLGFSTPQPVFNPDLFDTVCRQGNFGASDRPAQVAGAGCMFTLPRVETRFPSESGQFGAALRWFAAGLNDTEFGFYFMNYHSRLPLVSGTTVSNSALTSGNFFTEYPEDIELYGISFNTTLPGGWAWQGEYSYRPNQPLQIDDVEVLFAGLSPLNAAIPQPALQFRSQLGQFAPNTEIQGWTENEVGQLQMTFTKLFGPNNPFGAEEWVVLGEVGGTYVYDLADKDQLRYEGPGTNTGGGPDVLTGALRNPQTQEGGFADDFSWGYRLVTRLDYFSAFGTAWTMSPRLGFNHDVSGTSPGPGGNFIEDRKSVTVGLSFNYLQRWVADFSYTSFFGAEEFNLIHDRDFFSASLQYSF